MVSNAQTARRTGARIEEIEGHSEAHVSGERMSWYERTESCEGFVLAQCRVGEILGLIERPSGLFRCGPGSIFRFRVPRPW